MSYFPKREMPLTPKQNAPGAPPTGPSTISADDFNRHDEEIQAIEQYLSGDAPPPASSCGLPAPLVPGPTLSQIVATLTDRLNTFVEDGVSASSGYVLEGERVVFPEQARAAFLSSGAAQQDKSIFVQDTTGFPSAGYISILNPVRITPAGQPVGQSTVEWIAYNGKTQTSFLNCERGALGTSPMPHPVDNSFDLWIFNGADQIPAGTVVDPDGEVAYAAYSGGSVSYYGKLVRTSSPTTNIMAENAPFLINGIVSQYNRLYPPLRYFVDYSIASLSLVGTRRALIYAIGTSPQSVDLNAPGTTLVVEAAASAGVLLTVGEQSFLSGTLGRNALTGTEATSFVDAMIANGAAIEIEGPDDVAVPTQLIPVFQGRMSVNYSTLSVLAETPINGAYPDIEVCQTGGGKMYARQAGTNQEFLRYVACSYHTMFVPSLETRAERNRT